jgi:CheY-like chemotaxis protein
LPKQIWLLTSRSQKELILALQQIGYDVVVTEGVQVSAEVKQYLAPDLIVCDHKIESSSAIEVHQQLAAIECFKSSPFMVTFNGRDVHEIEKLIKSGVGDILLSPYASAQNLKKIQDICPLAPKGRRLRALVVDDSPTIRSLIVAKFKELDYQVETASNGFEGYKAVQRFKPDIITSDYDMPVLNGWQFCCEVRAHDDYKDIPIIMITLGRVGLSHQTVHTPGIEKVHRYSGAGGQGQKRARNHCQVCRRRHLESGQPYAR